ncbi:MAG: phasin family protein [Janthinobacterium lividum]
MSIFQEQFSAATKAQMQAQLAFMTSLTGKAIESLEKIVELNMNAAKASFDESSANLKDLLAAKDSQEFFSLLSVQAQPNSEKALAYSRHVGVIVSGLQTEISSAAEAQIAENNRKVGALVDEVSKNAPPRVRKM